MREKGWIETFGKEKLKFLAVVLFFLCSGIWYSHSFYGEKLEMGTAITAEEIGKPTEAAASAEEKIRKCNINHASAEELMLLSGIGEQRAADIIAYRKQNGEFQRIEDIMQVSGIGEKTFAKIKEQITVEE